LGGESVGHDGKNRACPMSNEYCRPATFDDVVTLIKSLNENQVPYLLIGGYALFAHGYHRATEDIDILVGVGPEVGPKLVRALECLPDHSAREMPAEWFYVGETENVRLADAYVVDLLLVACGETFETLQPYAEIIEIQPGVMLRTLNLQGLLRTKQTVREKDVMDRMVLERALQAINEAKSEGVNVDRPTQSDRSSG